MHDGILIFIFLALVLLFPIAIFVRVYGVTYSGLRTSGSSKKTSKSKQQPEQNAEKQAEQKQDSQQAE